MEMKWWKKAAAFGLSLVTAASMGFTGTAFAESGDASGGLQVKQGSNGTLISADASQASITLRNPTSQDIPIYVSTLGETQEVDIKAGSSYTASAPSIYDESGNAYKLALTGTDGKTTKEFPVSEGEELDPSYTYTVSIVRGVYDVYASHGQETPRWITCMIYADENGVDLERSVLSGVSGDVAAGDTSVSDISICSENDNTAAIRVGGSGSFTVKDADISLTGNGGDDFTGIGSAFGVADQGTLTVTDSKAYTSGILRSAIFAGDEGQMDLSGVEIDCEPGEYQQDVKIDSAGMASPPAGLGIWGNCRAMNMVDSATVNITDSTITSQNWGALGVDDIEDGHLNVKDSTINIKDQGYGCYSIGKCVDKFEGCTFNINYGVVGYAAAGDGSQIILTGGTVANSPNYYGIVTHQSFNGDNSKITVSGDGTQLNGGYAGILVKGRGADIEIKDGGVVTAKDGDLVRAQLNDDTMAGSMDGTEVVNVLIQDTDLTGNIIQGMGAPDASGNASGDLSGVPANLGTSGDSAAASSTSSTMNVTLDGASLTGAISSATIEMAISDGKISFDNIKEVGMIKGETLECNPYAKLNVELKNGSSWALDQDCSLMSLTLDDSSKIAGTDGQDVMMKVDGKETELKAGTYKGNIQLLVATGAKGASADAASGDTASGNATSGGMGKASAGIWICVAAVVLAEVVRRKKSH